MFEFPVWKTIELGTGLKSVKDFKLAFKQSGCQLVDLRNGLFVGNVFRCERTGIEVDLVDVSVADLGFKQGEWLFEGGTLVTTADIYRRARELDLKLCPREVAPQLRLQYLDQSIHHDRLVIATEPIKDVNGFPFLLVVQRSGDSRLLTLVSGMSTHRWTIRWHNYCGEEYRFVFVKPRK